MKPRPTRIKGKTPEAGPQKLSKPGIRKFRGKYMHLNLMKGLVEVRQEERQPDSEAPRAISARSLKMLDKSAASLKKGLASAPIAKPKKRALGSLKGWMEIKGDIIHSDMEDDWEVQ
jgi:hypothetical protein